MQTLQNELISFFVITLVVLMLAYLTHKKQQQFKDKDEEK
jgi:hypothetical protein